MCHDLGLHIGLCEDNNLVILKTHGGMSDSDDHIFVLLPFFPRATSEGFLLSFLGGRRWVARGLPPECRRIDNLQKQTAFLGFRPNAINLVERS